MSNNNTELSKKDSIVLFFFPYFSSNLSSTDELASIAKNSSITDTIWVNHREFLKLKKIISNKKYVSSHVIGVPELYIEYCGETVFLTLFSGLAVDIDRKPIMIDTAIVSIINKTTYLYNYFTKEDLLSNRYFISNGIPKDYHYVYTKNELNKTMKRRFKSQSIQKKGVKLLIIDGDKDS